MLSNTKFKAIEDLKMSRAEEYDYNKFLSDSSDDYPKYEDLIKKEDSVKYRQCDDDWFYSNEFNSIKNTPHFSGTNIELAKSDNKELKKES